MNLAIKLSNLMTISGVSEIELANAIGMDRSTFNKILNGKTPNPRLDTVKALSKYFNINIDELVNDSYEHYDTGLNTAHILQKLIYAHGNLSLSVLAEKMGIAKSILSKILNNKVANPQPSTLQQIASYFNISVAQLTGAVEISKPQSRALRVQALAIVDINNVINFKRSVLGNNVVKYVNIALEISFSGGFLLRISDDVYYPEFTSPCHLVVTNDLPTINKCFVVAKNRNKCTIFKYTKENDCISLQEIGSNIIQHLSQEEFTSVFIGSITQTIFGDIR